MSGIFKVGLLLAGAGLLCYMLLFVVYGGIGPCALPGQMEMLLLAILLTLSGGIALLISTPAVLLNKYRNRKLDSHLTLFQDSPRH